MRQRNREPVMIIANELTCQHLVEVVTDYLEGALSSEQRVAFENHIADCPYCAEYLDQMRLTIALTGSVDAEDLSVLALDTLLGAFRDWKEGRSAT